MLSAIAATMPKRSVILPMTTPPRPKPMKIMVVASDTAPRDGRKFRLHGRQHDHDRPHADRPDRGDQDRQHEAPPGLTGIRGEVRGTVGLSGGGVHGRHSHRRLPKGQPTMAQD